MSPKLYSSQFSTPPFLFLETARAGREGGGASGED